MLKRKRLVLLSVLCILIMGVDLLIAPIPVRAQNTQDQIDRIRPGRIPTDKPVLHGRHWVAITGKPLGATAGARIFSQGGNAVDAACAMLGVTCTMYDVLSWGGETQALVFNPETGKVIGINALGVAPTGATPEFFQEQGMEFPPSNGPLAAVTPGTPGGLLTMLAEFGTMSLKEVLQPSIEMADGYPIEASVANQIERSKRTLMQWPYSKKVFYQGRDISPFLIQRPDK